jgi:hypothetical protein
MPAGRPTKYEPRYNRQVEKLCKLGATDKEIADFFEISESTLNLWKLEYSKFSEAIKKGKVQADAEVADKLFKRATGYSHPDVDIKVIDGKIVITKLTKHYPPDTMAGMYWMNNRRNRVKDGSLRWANKQEIDHTSGGEKLGTVPIVTIQNPNDDAPQ